jgi:hypothetical protein
MPNCVFCPNPIDGRCTHHRHLCWSCCPDYCDPKDER